MQEPSESTELGTGEAMDFPAWFDCCYPVSFARTGVLVPTAVPLRSDSHSCPTTTLSSACFPQEPADIVGEHLSPLQTPLPRPRVSWAMGRGLCQSLAGAHTL